MIAGGLACAILGSAASGSAAASVTTVPGALRTCRSLAAHSAVLRTSKVVVYRTDRPGTPGAVGARYWVCAPGGRYATPFGEAANRPQPRDAITTHIIAARVWVTAFESSREGWSAVCARGAGSCRRIHHQIELINGADGISGSVSTAAEVGRVLVSAAGAVVWTQRANAGGVQIGSEVVGGGRSCSGVSSGFVARGAIVPKSLRLTGLTLRFTESGRERTVRLPRPSPGC